MKRIDLIASVIILVCGLFMLIVVIPRECPPGEAFGLPPALPPTVFMSIISTLAGLLFVSLLLSKNGSQDDSPQPLSLSNISYITVVCLFLFAILALIKYAGYLIGGATAIGSLMVYLGTKNPIKIAFVSLAVPAVIFLICKHLLNVPMP